MEKEQIIERVVKLPPDQADRLNHLAQTKQMSEDEIIAEALDLLFGMTDRLSRRSLYGLFLDLGPAPSDEEIDATRVEMWADFPHEDIA